jgi:hypothetical protein
MHWPVIRDHFAARLKASGATQQQVAQAGQLHAQTAISKLLDNEKRGPSVETFVRAVHGLGMTCTAFFAELEQQTPPAPPLPPVDPTLLLDRLTAVEQALTSFMTQAPADAPLPFVQYTGRSAHVESSSLSGTGAGVIHHTTVGLGLVEFEALLRKHVDVLRPGLERLAAQMAEDVRRRRSVHRKAARARGRSRGKRRKSA